MTTIVNESQLISRILDSSGNNITSTGNALDVNISGGYTTSLSKTTTPWDAQNLTGGGPHFTSDIDVQDCGKVSIYGTVTDACTLTVYYKKANEATTLTNTILSNYSYVCAGAQQFVLDIPNMGAPWMLIACDNDQTLITIHVSCKP